MKHTKFTLLVIACCVVGAGFFVGIGKDYITSATGGVSPTPVEKFYSTTRQMPDEVMYFVLFHEIKALKERDAEFHAKGENTNFRETYYKSTLGLSPDKFAKIDSVYADYFTRLAPVDARAKKIIDEYRAKYPKGELKSVEAKTIRDPGFEKPGPVPPELNDLQKTRDQLGLDARDKLRQALGQDDFAQLEKNMRDHAAKVLRPVNLKGTELPPIQDVERGKWKEVGK